MNNKVFNIPGNAPSVLNALFCLGVFANSCLAVTVNLDGNDEGRVFEGIGGVSAGASSRLLYDYADPYRSDILDYLFRPKFGAGFQHLKVEMGGGENSTCGSEPSHAVTREELANPVSTRGYEFWLAREARDRNPNVILDALAWSYPGWFSTTWSQDHADYIAAFLKAAEQGWDLKWDWFGACKNERGYNRDWIVNTLKPTLDAAGYSHVKLHASEEIAGWDIADVLVRDQSFSDALDAISVHYVSRAESRTSTSNARAWGKSLWASEEWSESGSSWAESIKLARNINMLYIRDRITKHSIWCPIDAIYGNGEEPIWYASVGAMQADTPWSGRYEIWPSTWAVAHTTQFAEPGWIYLNSGSGRPSSSTWNGSYVTLKHPNGEDYSIVIVTGSATDYTFNLRGGLSTAPVHVWRTNSNSWFEQQNDITPSGSSFTLRCEANSIYSITTTTGQQKGSAEIPREAPFPFPYSDSYNSYKPGESPRYHSDQKGSFEVVDDDEGKVLRQIMPEQGILWGDRHNTDKPTTVFGGLSWRDYDVGVDVLIDDGNVELSARVGEVKQRRGYRLVLFKNGNWRLMVDGSVSKSGSVSGFDGNTWHNLKLSCSGSSIRAFIDEKEVTSLNNGTRAMGMASLGSSYNYNSFDNLYAVEVGGDVPLSLNKPVPIHKFVILQDTKGRILSRIPLKTTYLSNTSDPISLQIFDLKGRFLFESKLDNDKLAVITENWRAGLYLARLGSKGQYTAVKFNFSPI